MMTMTPIPQRTENVRMAGRIEERRNDQEIQRRLGDVLERNRETRDLVANGDKEQPDQRDSPASVVQQMTLVAAMRETARWRRAKAIEHADDKIAAHRSSRAMTAIQIAAKFVESLALDDTDLRWLRYVEADGKRLLLSEESWELLSRFGMDRGAWNQGGPTEAQIRKLLRRLSGAESRARGDARRDAE